MLWLQYFRNERYSSTETIIKSAAGLSLWYILSFQERLNTGGYFNVMKIDKTYRWCSKNVTVLTIQGLARVTCGESEEFRETGWEWDSSESMDHVGFLGKKVLDQKLLLPLIITIWSSFRQNKWTKWTLLDLQFLRERKSLCKVLAEEFPKFQDKVLVIQCNHPFYHPDKGEIRAHVTGGMFCPLNPASAYQWCFQSPVYCYQYQFCLLEALCRLKKNPSRRADGIVLPFACFRMM